MNDDLIPKTEGSMQKSVEALKEDLATIRTGRASSVLVENIRILAYQGTQELSLKEMATITTDGARTIIVAPFDVSVLAEIEKGINSANLGFTASTDSNVIRISIPSLTEEKRLEYIKLAGQKVEGGRIMIRQVRHEAMSTIKHAFEKKETTEDDKTRFEKEIQKLTDKYMEEIEAIREKKEHELTSI